MTHFRKKYLLALLFGAVLFASCKKQWSVRDDVTDPQLNVNLYQQIQANSNLSVFAGYLAKFGYDKLLASSKSFTVFAPTNTALSALSGAITADTAQLHLFVANHIANSAFFTGNIGVSYRIRNLNGKKMTFTPATIEDANITTANIYVNNGVLDIIDKPLYYRLNADQYLRAQTAIGLMQRDFVKTNDSTYIDTTKATVDHIDPSTGKPILVPGTGQVTINKYYNRARVLPGSEDSLYTYIILTDGAYTAERTKVSKYFATSSVDTTNMLAGYNVLKDVVVRGVYPLTSIGASLTSATGVPVPFDKSQVLQTYNASNGIVYVMGAVNFDIKTKITPITIQGEAPSFFRQPISGNNNIRLRNDLNGVAYRDLFTSPISTSSSSTGISAYFAAYKLSNLYTCQYKVYLRAVNDTLFTHIPITTATPSGYTVTSPNGTPYVSQSISERILFGQLGGAVATNGVYAITTAVNYPYQNVTPYFYAEIQQNNAVAGTASTVPTINVVSGNLNVIKYNSINMYVVGQTSTAVNYGDILVDYIRLEPIIQ